MRTRPAVLLALAPALLATWPASQAREVRAAARTSVNQAGSAGINRGAGATAGRNPNTSRQVNVNQHVDIDVDVDHDYHPVARAAAVTTAAVATTAVIGSMVHAIPPNCQTVIVAGVTYSQCGSTWYMPQMQGSATTYVVVAPAR